MNGKLNGIVQAYGKVTVDPIGHCSQSVKKGLSFIGYFKNGKPTGPCWRFLLGGTFIYGIVDENGEFTGSKDIAFIYQDQELAMIGDFNRGLMVSEYF